MFPKRLLSVIKLNFHNIHSILLYSLENIEYLKAFELKYFKILKVTVCSFGMRLESLQRVS